MFYADIMMQRAEKALENEKQESERLLLNILPAIVATELKLHGKTVPQEYASVTVMFTDFVGFTRVAETMTPRELVEELDQCFSYFDSVTEKYNLEKLKTIGDSFMTAGGVPRVNHTHPYDCVLAAMEIQSFMNLMKELRTEKGLPYWELRLGIHTGPLVAGVVGKKKFAYDVWGDTVNTASRLESSGIPGKINISSSTYQYIKFLFDCKKRGEIAAKNKGLMDMYFVEGLKQKFSVEGDHRVPNSEFKKVYQRIQNGAKLVSTPSPKASAITIV